MLILVDYGTLCVCHHKTRSHLKFIDIHSGKKCVGPTCFFFFLCFHFYMRLRMHRRSAEIAWTQQRTALIDYEVRGNQETRNHRNFQKPQWHWHPPWFDLGDFPSQSHLALETPHRICSKHVFPERRCLQWGLLQGDDSAMMCKTRFVPFSINLYKSIISVNFPEQVECIWRDRVSAV